jgi:hypothetical protein
MLPRYQQASGLGMSDRKPYRFRPPLYHQGQADGPEAHRRARTENNASNQSADNQEGWDAYRRWLSRVSGQSTRRSPLDASVYSWKGYHSWAEKVRQDWEPE